MTADGVPRLRRAAAWRAAEERRRRARDAPRASSSSPASTPTTTACWPSAARSTSATSIMRAFRLLHEHPHVRERTSRALPARARGRVPGHELRPGDAAAAAGGRAPQRDRGRRRRPGDLPLPRRVAEEPRSTSSASSPTPRWSGSSATTAPGGASSTRPRAVVEPCPDRIDKELRGASGGRVRFWRCRSERAQAQAVAAEAERLIADGVAPDEICVLVRSVKNEGAVVASALEERALPSALVGLGRLLPARRGARRARVAARARRPERLGRGGARAVAAAGRAALGGRGAADPARPAAQARHALGDRGGARGAAALRGGARPRARVPAPLPLGLAAPSRTAGPTPSCCA